MENRINSCMLLRTGIKNKNQLTRLNEKIPSLKSCDLCGSMKSCQSFIKAKLDETLNPKESEEKNIA